MLLTVADVLNMPELRSGPLVVLAAPQHLDRQVHRLHISELAGTSSLLRGRELTLTTGIALPDDPVRLRAYVDELARSRPMDR